ncbi:MAG: hypothetical protein JHC95_00815 [Solirubrobacteraceae bacterium]|nr:hypothetical protein [Solirubrobacteraceae bacterium]
MSRHGPRARTRNTPLLAGIDGNDILSGDGGDGGDDVLQGFRSTYV